MKKREEAADNQVSEETKGSGTTLLSKRKIPVKDIAWKISLTSTKRTAKEKHRTSLALSGALNGRPNLRGQQNTKV